MNDRQKDVRLMKRFLQLRCASMLTVLLLLFSISASADSANIDPQADKILRSMSSYLGSLSSFSVKANVEYETVMDNGQKLQLTSFANLAIKRPNKMRVTSKGLFAEEEMVYDGKIFTLHSKKPNVYIQKNVPGTVDDVIRFFEFETGLDAPGADLLFADSYSILKSGVMRGEYIGTTMFDGVECYYLAFRENNVDWQLWVKVGSEPLPMKYVITSKWVTAAPQYTAHYYDWNTKAKIPASQFKFSIPKGARRLDSLFFSKTGEMKTEQEGQ